MSYPRVASFKTADAFLAYLDELGIELPFIANRTADRSSLAEPLELEGRKIGNRFCILPMEGWDGTTDGRPTEHVSRRWQRFGLSGAKLIWGGEAVAVSNDGRANPNQLWLHDENVDDLATLRQTLIDAHQEKFGNVDDLLVGLQLTHSGRFARPGDKKQLQPQILYHHSLLEEKYAVGDNCNILTDDDIRRLVDKFVLAASRAYQAGFQFVDVKHCHGYLGHEFLSSKDRPGPYGGSLENRTRFLREVVNGIRSEVPRLLIGIRISAIDGIPYHKGKDGIGEPMRTPDGNYPYAFGGDSTGLAYDLTEPKQLLDHLAELDIHLVCITVGSPYYNPHIQRPALFPPSDGYLPPEDPLVGVARQIAVTAELKKHQPQAIIVGSGYSYLQEWLPNVAQAVIEQGLADSIGLGRLVLSYPEFPADCLVGRPMQTKKFCRTFSDCTSAPRNGMISGCYPLDPYYKQMSEAAVVKGMRSQKS